MQKDIQKLYEEIEVEELPYSNDYVAKDQAIVTSSSSVNHPSHYNQGSIECIDAIRAALGDQGFMAFCKGNAMKYLWRCEHKGHCSEDLEKAVWYIDRLIKAYRGNINGN